jgi:hypothetical protein
MQKIIEKVSVLCIQSAALTDLKVLDDTTHISSITLTALFLASFSGHGILGRHNSSKRYFSLGF